jgi:methyltransferase (TIGR00027 family)
MAPGPIDEARLRDHGVRPLSSPDRTAVRVALWRAQHLVVDERPLVLEDDIGRLLVAPRAGWLDHPERSEAWRPWRASVVARARLVEDLVVDRVERGVDQYALLGAGLDSFAIRHPELSTRLSVFEVDEPETQEWKRQRLHQLRIALPPRLAFVPVDFESHSSWAVALASSGFDRSRPALVASTGVLQYLTVGAIRATMRVVASLGPGTVFVSSFIVRRDLIDPKERSLRAASEESVAASGHPWLSSFAPSEFAALARAAGFDEIAHVSSADLAARYFAGRRDGLRPSSSEDRLITSRK